MENQSAHWSPVQFGWLIVNFIFLAVILLVPPWKIVKHERWPNFEPLISSDMRADPIPGTWGPLHWAPVWDPPSAFMSDRNEVRIPSKIDAPTRWPWINAEPGFASEIDHTRLVATFSLLVILNSFIAVIGGWIGKWKDQHNRNRHLTAFGGGQMLAWFAFGLIGAASMGFAWQPVTFYGALGAGLLASCVYLAFLSLQETSRKAESTKSDSTNQVTASATEARSIKTDAPVSAPNASRGFLGFFVAMPVSFLFLVIASKVGEPFKGRSIGGSPFGEVREHEYLVNYISGLTLLGVGSLTGSWLTKKRWTRGFGFGLIVGAIIVGALKFFEH